MTLRTRAVRAAYWAMGYEEIDPWDEAIARRKRLGMEGPTGPQIQAMKIADAVLAEVASDDDHGFEEESDE